MGEQQTQAHTNTHKHRYVQMSVNAAHVNVHECRHIQMSSQTGTNEGVYKQVGTGGDEHGQAGQAVKARTSRDMQE